MSTPLASPSLTELHDRLPELMLRDARRLRRRIEGARKLRDKVKRAAVTEELAAEVAAAQIRVENRRNARPRIRYPEQLPVSQRKDEILAAIRDHQVVIVAGETGSGKTTQLPKICLELGRGVQGLIGHTQPRRLAARTVAERIAEELGSSLGEVVGYQVRFTDQSSTDTLVKLMTDGILLAEIQNDKALSRYDTLIIDEAHERSLNVDFLLGYLAQLLPRRPDLKVIITSATIDPERFSRHFGDAPIIEVSGRTYPVEVRYRPVVDPDDPEDDGERDQVQAISDAVDELMLEGPGDILVFLSGEREIRDTADALEKRELRNTEVVPLYARLSAAEQHRVFQQHTGRRIVLATNVAETSLTVPGIKYVIDPGTARISRYSHRTKVQRLPIEPVSQASANQRKGRCGRVSEGICIRLYSEEDFLARPEFTDPEILRTNLASVILQMTSLGLGDLAAFPFIDPPDPRNITAGVQLLQELGALDPEQSDPKRRLTSLGRKLSQLPVDPRLARMVLAADELGCLREVLVITSALSIQDPRERPSDKQQDADSKHARFADPTSDFLAYLKLWDYLREQQKELSSNRFRKQCRAEYLNYLRVREWQDIHSQLRQVVKNLGLTLNSNEAGPQQIHTALLSGLLSHIGLQEERRKEYLGARSARFAIFPGSALFKKPPRWVMAAELVETSRLWARIAARIEPEWVEPLAQHLIKRTYSEPHWEKKQGAVMAVERVTLYGIPLVVDRKVNYGRIEPELCRELFIRHALVEGDWHTSHKFFHANRALLQEVEKLEDRARRRDIMVDDETLFALYDERIGKDVVSARHFDSWWKKTRHEKPDLLTFTKQTLINATAGAVTETDYPDDWRQGDVALPLTYRFEPGRKDDGVTAHIPVGVLNQVTGDGFAWHIPGLRKDIVVALLKSLPKNLRRNFVPVPDVAQALLAKISAEDGNLLDAVEEVLHELTGIDVPREAWQLDQVPDHLKTTYRVTDEGGKVLAEGKDLAALKKKLTAQVRRTLSSAGSELERTGLTDWTIGTLPRTFSQERNGFTVTAYPALVDEGDTAGVRMLDTAADQRRMMWRGTRRLLLLTTPSPVKQLQRGLSNKEKLTLSRNPHGGVADLLVDCINAAADKLIAAGGGPAWDEAGFAKLREGVRKGLQEATFEVVGHVAQTLGAWHEVEAVLETTAGKGPLETAWKDVRTQVSSLVYKGFATATGWSRLSHLPRYLEAARRRLEKVAENPRRDAELQAQVTAIQQALAELRAEVPQAAAGLAKIRWMVEELRVSYFAQQLGTAYPVSDKRIYRAMDELLA
ncbi:ATP-dependent helicase HrpA [Crossiella equi]|uniref:ATP-dependent helicase HrpA n=1 Tax=Crossiella equi TaxID=130796 RepID=A0ABS5A7M9_9PSEU|nr:ATP-dependent RNA helicase HrpA [Crossiella equi]MBP2472580.1 ATP-dependent helicase HrpA [Crossiella equi]